jgi:protein-tyrosine-phosphatase
MTTRVVFICTANICRSPMAEGIFNHSAGLAGRSDLHGTSMGTHAMEGQPASAFSQQVCQEKEIDLSGHRSRPLIGEELREADLILCMEKGHAHFVKTFFPWNRDRIFLVGAWPGKASRKSPVEDPVGAPVGVFQQVFDMLQLHIDRIIQHL